MLFSVSDVGKIESAASGYMTLKNSTFDRLTKTESKDAYNRRLLK